MTSVLRQFLKILSIRLRKSVQKIIIIHDYQERNVSLSNSPELKNEKVYY